jgi:hypothetical protein
MNNSTTLRPPGQSDEKETATTQDKVQEVAGEARSTTHQLPAKGLVNVQAAQEFAYEFFVHSVPIR